MAISLPYVPRWLGFVSLWLLLAFVFASQLFWAGYVTPWSKAFSQEVIYWLSWGIIAPVIFWMCRRLHAGKQTWSRYVLGFALGALGASISGAGPTAFALVAGTAVGERVAAAMREAYRAAGVECTTRVTHVDPNGAVVRTA